MTHVNFRSCCNSYLSLAMSSMMRLPSVRFGSSTVSETARWTSSMAPVWLKLGIHASGRKVPSVLTTMTGHRSLAEMYAKDVLSEVEATAERCQRGYRLGKETYGSWGRSPTFSRVAVQWTGNGFFVGNPEEARYRGPSQPHLPSTLLPVSAVRYSPPKDQR